MTVLIVTNPETKITKVIKVKDLMRELEELKNDKSLFIRKQELVEYEPEEPAKYTNKRTSEKVYSSKL